MFVQFPFQLLCTAMKGLKRQMDSRLLEKETEAIHMWNIQPHSFAHYLNDIVNAYNTQPESKGVYADNAMAFCRFV